MEELDLSVMVHTPNTAVTLQELLQEFQAIFGIHVNLTCLDWVTARAELNKSALYRLGPDVSEVGSTWVPDLINMDVLTPLRPYETQGIARSGDFVQAAWSTVQMPEDTSPWALPWHAETYVIYYRRDLLKEAGVDEKTAFKTHAEIKKTAARLAKIGVPVPVELTLQTDRYGMLHSLASWIWAYGGDFVSPDGRQLLLGQPRAMQAIQDYFGLLKYATPEGCQAMRDKIVPLFQKGSSAITFGTMRLATLEGKFPREVIDNMGWAALPQPCFVGGSNIVIWKHTRNKLAALKLVAFLTKASTLARSNLPLATLPPRLEVLQTPAFTEDPMLSVMADAISKGRAYPPLRLWGIIEDKLVSALLKIGADLLANPKGNTDEIIARGIEDVTRRADSFLSQ